MLVLDYSESELNSVCLVGFLSLLERFWNFLRIYLNEMDWLENHISRFFQIRFSGNAVCVVWLVLVSSHSSELRINHRLSCWIPESFRKVLEIFENLSQ